MKSADFMGRRNIWQDIHFLNPGLPALWMAAYSVSCRGLAVQARGPARRGLWWATTPNHTNCNPTGALKLYATPTFLQILPLALISFFRTLQFITLLTGVFWGCFSLVSHCTISPRPRCLSLIHTVFVWTQLSFSQSIFKLKQGEWILWSRLS